MYATAWLIWRIRITQQKAITKIHHSISLIWIYRLNGRQSQVILCLFARWISSVSLSCSFHILSYLFRAFSDIRFDCMCVTYYVFIVFFWFGLVECHISYLCCSFLGGNHHTISRAHSTPNASHEFWATVLFNSQISFRPAHISMVVFWLVIFSMNCLHAANVVQIIHQWFVLYINTLYNNLRSFFKN